MVRVEFTVVTQASRELAWKLFTNIYLWRRFADVYGDIEWRSGAPWEVGSRLKIELTQPVKTTVDHVITICTAPNTLAWIDHALGNTMEQWVHFEAMPNGGTRVHTWADLAGSTLSIDGKPVLQILTEFTEQWYSRFCDECDLAAEQELQMA